jgi:hypothetical protein
MRIATGGSGGMSLAATLFKESDPARFGREDVYTEVRTLPSLFIHINIRQ